jgi:alpha-mannosidase
MTLTAAEKERVLGMLDQMDGAKKNALLASFEAFSNWLKVDLPQIFVKIKESIQSIWQSICNFFS